MAQLRAKHAKKQSVQKKAWGRKKPPDPVLKIMEEQSKLLRVSRAKRAERFADAMKAHGAFRRFISSLKLNRLHARSPAPGIVDADLAGLIEELRLEMLPEGVRVLALEECDRFICDVSLDVHGTSDEAIPWLLPAGVSLSLTEARQALQLR